MNCLASASVSVSAEDQGTGTEEQFAMPQRRRLASLNVLESNYGNRGTVSDASERRGREGDKGLLKEEAVAAVSSTAEAPEARGV